jgi:hypothetical protein
MKTKFSGLFFSSLLTAALTAGCATTKCNSISDDGKLGKGSDEPPKAEAAASAAEIAPS